jgi:hypothetical protein
MSSNTINDTVPDTNDYLTAVGIRFYEPARSRPVEMPVNFTSPLSSWRRNKPPLEYKESREEGKLSLNQYPATYPTYPHSPLYANARCTGWLSTIQSTRLAMCLSPSIHQSKPIQTHPNKRS